MKSPTRGPLQRVLLPAGAGVLGVLVMSGVYLGIVSLAGSPAHALSLFWEDRALVIPILLGFGLQVGLFTLLKTGLYLPVHAPASGAVTAAGGGVSTAAMVACCVHHVADVLPLVGLSAAATFLANWKVPFMIDGLATNLLGSTLMLLALARAPTWAVTAVAS
jgi:hypothetical protein